MGQCLGICNRYETIRTGGYVKDFKWCTRCHLFIKVSSVMCPCCKTQIRVKSHQRKVLEIEN